MKGTASFNEQLELGADLLRLLASSPSQAKQEVSVAAEPTNGKPLTRRADSAHSLDAANALLAAQDDQSFASAESTTEAASARPSYYWTGRLLAAGFTVEECREIRSLGRDTILEHVQILSRQGDS